MAAHSPRKRRRSTLRTEPVNTMRAMAARALLLAVLGFGLPSVELAAPPAARVATHGMLRPPAQRAAHGPAASRAPSVSSAPGAAIRSTPRFAASVPRTVAVAGLHAAVKPQVSGRVGGPARYDARRGARIDGSLVAPRP
jgi:hypothetical protein